MDILRTPDKCFSKIKQDKPKEFYSVRSIGIFLFAFNYYLHYMISSIVHPLGFIILLDGSRRKSKERMQGY